MRSGTIFLIASLLALGCASPPPPVPWFPDASEVEGIAVTLLPSESDPKRDSTPFEVPATHIPDLIEMLSPPESFPRRGRVEELASLEIRCRDGRRVRVELFFEGKSPVTYRIEGVACVRGGPYREIRKDVFLAEATTVVGYLQTIRRGDAKEMAHFLEILRVSAGRAPE